MSTTHRGIKAGQVQIGPEVGRSEPPDSTDRHPGSKSKLAEQIRAENRLHGNTNTLANTNDSKEYSNDRKDKEEQE